MTESRLRRQIAFEAARLMYSREESEYFRAKLKAARRIAKGWVKPSELPSNAEIRDEIQCMARLFEGAKRFDELREMRVDALRMMRSMSRFRPRLIGSVLTGHIRAGSDIDLHLFSDSIEAVTHELDEQGLIYDVERKVVKKQGETRTFTHVHLRDRFDFELTIYAADQAHIVFKSSITGKPMDRKSIAELAQFMALEYPDLNLEDALLEASETPDRFRVYESLLLPLENVKQSPKWHPEGDALFHSLQVFDLARDQLAYDEEFLLAALLHDIGKAIDPHDHVVAGLEAIGDYITPRTRWLIAHHMDAQQILDGTLGARAKRRLQQDESYEELVLLARCDRGGRVPGAAAPELDEALEYLRDLSQSFS